MLEWGFESIPDRPIAAGDTGTLAGDYNADGVVDAADYTVWADNFGSSTNLAADGNGDGVVDAADYTMWRDGAATDSGPEGYAAWAANYGATLATSAATTPEPTAAVALLLGCGLAVGRRIRA